MDTVELALVAARARLAGVASAALDADLLLAHTLGWPRSRLYAYPEAELGRDARERFAALLEARAAGTPVAYLCGQREFWSLGFAVGRGVLVPRPESELVVELALGVLESHRQPRILDLGAGSGALGLALASERPDASVDLVERSPEALAFARGNAAVLGLGNARLYAGDWYAPLPAAARYTVIVANPPYLAAADPHLLNPELAHEPRVALVAGDSGLEALEQIVAGAPTRLEPGGALILEHGATQGAAVRALLEAAGFAEVRTHPDLAGHERATAGRRAG